MVPIPQRRASLAQWSAIVACAAAEACVASAGLAQVTYVSQSRSVWATPCFGAPPTVINATDFGPFDALVKFPTEFISGFASGQQTSSLNAWGISVKGGGVGAKWNGCFGQGVSTLVVVFQVDEPTTWELAGTISGYLGQWIPEQRSEVSLVGPGVNLFFTIEDGTMPIAASGTFAPGQYTLAAIGEGRGYGLPPTSAGSHEFQLDFGVPCYPDCDADGALSIDDFICFQTFFALIDPYADCDADGALSIDDFICFQTFFAIGC